MSDYIIEVYSPKTLPWDEIRKEVLLIEKAHFGDNSFSEKDFKHYFENKNCVFVLARERISKNVVGFTFTRPTIDAYLDDWHGERLPEVRKLNGKSAYIDDIAVAPDFIGKGITPLMINKLEKILVSQGYKYLEEDAAVSNGYADQVERAYAADNRLIVAGLPHESQYGLQRFFRMLLLTDE